MEMVFFLFTIYVNKYRPILPYLITVFTLQISSYQSYSVLKLGGKMQEIYDTK